MNKDTVQEVMKKVTGEQQYEETTGFARVDLLMPDFLSFSYSTGFKQGT